MTTEIFQDITFSDIQKGDVIQMKRPSQSRFGKRIAIASAWDHEVAGRVFGGMRATDKLIVESIDANNHFRRITVK